MTLSAPDDRPAITYQPTATLIGKNGGRVTRGEADSAQQATEADWLTRASDTTCVEPSKTQTPSSMPVTLQFSAWRHDASKEMQNARETKHFLAYMKEN
jgi:hypothetical protein